MKYYLKTNKHHPLTNHILLSGKFVNVRINQYLEIVFNNLEKANKHFNRLVKANEIYEFISIHENKNLKTATTNDLLSITVISEILESLIRKNLAFKKSYAFNKFYGSARVFDPVRTEIAFEFASKPQQVLKIINEAVTFYGRSVCYNEIFEFAEDRIKLNSRRLIIESLRTLQKAKLVKITARYHGSTRGGIYYLPSDLNETLFPTPIPNTALDCTKCVFDELWNEQLESLCCENSLPLPLLTSDIQARMEIKFPDMMREKKPGFMTATLWQLAKTKKSNIRGIQLNETRQVCWSPKNLTNNQLNIKSVYANDRIKLIEAVERACLRRNQPVNAKDVQYEINLDNSLQLQRHSKTSTALSSSANFFDVRMKKQNLKVERFFYNLGLVKGNSYYCSNNFDRKLASSFIEFYQLENQWEELIKIENLEKLKECRISVVKAGRILLFLREAVSIQNKLKDFLELKVNNAALNNRINILYSTLSEFIPKFHDLLNELNNEDFPIGFPSEDLECWTAKEMIDSFIPVHPLALEMEAKSKHGITSRVTGILRKSVRRISLKEQSKPLSSLSPFAYDKTDALIFAGLNWGGHECRMQANYARIELGLLRDVNFIIPGLNSDRFEIRMSVVACLAFIQTDKGNSALRNLIHDDPVAEVKMAALWAYAFAKGRDAYNIAEQIALKETTSYLGQFADRISKTKPEDLWFI